MLGWIAAGFFQVALATPATPLSRRLSRHQWRVEEGLPQNSVTDIVQDDDGFLWLSTFGGLARFDGREFRVYDLVGPEGLPTNRLVSLAHDDAGLLWLGSEHHGLLSFDGERVHRVPVSEAVDLSEVSDIHSRGSEVWAATTAGLVDAKRRTVVRDADGESFPPLRTTFVDEQGRVWFGGVRGLGLVEDGVGRWLWTSTEVWSIASDRAGGLWVLTLNGLEHFSADSLVQPTPQAVLHHGFDPGWRPAMVEDGQGRVWLATATGTLGWIDDGDVHMLGPGTATPARALLVDRSGSIWMGTVSDGLVQLVDRRLEAWGLADGVPQRVRTVLESGEGGLWIGGCDAPLVEWQGDAIRPVLAEVLGEQCVNSLHRGADNTVYVGHNNNLSTLLRGADGAAQLVPLATGLPGSVQSILSRPSGPLWVGTTVGVVQVDRSTGAWIPVDVLGAGEVHVLRTQGADLLVGSVRGLARLQPDGSVTWITSHREGGPRLGPVRDILVDPDGTLWLGTYGGGLVRIQDGVLVRFTTKDGLRDNVVSRVIDDGAGRLWLNGNLGLTTVKRQDLRARASGGSEPIRIVQFESGEGMGGSAPAGGLTAEGDLWMPVLHGVVRVDLGAFRADLAKSTPPHVVLEAVTLNDEPVAEGAVVAPSHPRDLAARVAATTLEMPEQTRIQHRLLGLDDHWQDLDGHTLRYPHLSPGSYTLEVRAVDARGQLSGVAQVRNIRLLPAWHEHWWLSWAVSGLVLLIALVFGTSRVRVVRQHNEQLEGEVGRRRDTEEALREREARYRAVFDGNEQAMVIHEPSGALVAANRASVRLLGAPRGGGVSVEAVAAHFVEDALRQRYVDVVRDACAGAVPEPLEGAWQVRDGLVVTVRCTSKVFPLAVGHGALVTLADVTEVRRAESSRVELNRRIQRAQTVEALAQLSGEVAHDFNNLLTVIAGAASAIALGDEPEPEALGQEILACSAKGARLVRRLLAMGQRQRWQAAPVNLAAELRGMRSVLRAALPDDVVLELVFEESRVSVKTDSAFLERALLNLALNARDAMPEGGKLDVKLSAVQLDAAQLTTLGGAHLSPGAFAVIEVSDTGVGMPEALVPQIFQPFFTTKGADVGSGLGLSGVRSFAQRSGGLIHVQSSEGVGTSFFLYLPMAQEVLGSSAPAPAQEQVLARLGRTALAGLTILVCDDQDDVLRMATRVLQGRGAMVLSTSDPLDALRVADEHQGPIDVVVSDVVMPGIKGPELVARLHELRPDVGVLYMSGYTRGVSLSGAPLLAKPFMPEALVAAVLGVMAKKRAGAGAPTKG